MPQKSEAKNRLCAICGCALDGLSKLSKICKKPKCVQERNRLKARKHGLEKLWFREKACIVCGQQFKTSHRQYKICSKACRVARARDAQYRFKAQEGKS